MLEAQITGKEVMLTVDEQGLEVLRDALDDVERGCKVFIGEFPGPLLILRPEGFAEASEAADG